ncbi:MAG: CRISPR-associated endonuclease Cas2 [Candidatus Eutrophobiaceae bacterium]
MSHYLSPYRIMWLFVMFDLPVGTNKERKAATTLRNDLLNMGFEMAQFSVYTKYCPSTERAETVCSHIKQILPANGKVDILTITDRQFGGMKRFYAQKPQKNAASPPQLHLF